MSLNTSKANVNRSNKLCEHRKPKPGNETLEVARPVTDTKTRVLPVDGNFSFTAPTCHCDVTVPTPSSGILCIYVIITHKYLRAFGDETSLLPNDSMRALGDETSPLPNDSMRPCLNKSRFYLVYKLYILTVSAFFMYKRNLQ